jgi:hypothetical protein
VAPDSGGSGLPAPGARSFCCPECGKVTTDRAAAQSLYCPACQHYTGVCGAGRTVKFLAGILPHTGGADWRHFCVRAGDGGRWLVITADNLAGAGTATVTVLCTPHRDALAQLAAAGWVHAQQIGYAPRQLRGLAAWWYRMLPGWLGARAPAGRHG